MAPSPRISRPLRCGAMVAVVIIAAGCAGTPRSSAQAPSTSTIAPATALAADSPMPTSQVVQSADFSLKAAREGYQTEVRNGVVLYCWTDASLGTRIPTKKCLNEAQVRLRMQQAQQERENAQRSLAAPACPSGMSCH